MSSGSSPADAAYFSADEEPERIDSDTEMRSSSVEGRVHVDGTQFRHGRLNPGLESTLGLVEGVELKEPATMETQRCPWNDSKVDSSLVPTFSLSRPDINTSGRDYLTSLPSELIDRIVTFIENPLDVVTLTKTSRALLMSANADIVWKRFVQDNVPGTVVDTAGPCKTYKELFISHDPHWFLPKYKIWFSDYFLTGKIIVTRYDPRRGCIEGFRLVAERCAPTFDAWEEDEEVLIHSFCPHARLHMDQPVLHLSITQDQAIERISARKRFAPEIPMLNASRNHNGVYSNFLLTRPVEEHPGMQLWPPRTIPARHRVRNSSQSGFKGGHEPEARMEISDQSFRIRHWMEMTGGANAPRIRVGEEVYTYATLDPKLYTPTEEKPWKGIWVGDYSGHGCEFLLMNQPDSPPFDEASVIQLETETVEEFEQRKKDERIYRGRLEAIKLTGDPNIPRGEYTFIAEDLSATIRTASDPRFKNARVVDSRGHIALQMFRDDKYIESQLILVSHDVLAQYWVEFGHISFYRRVDIDRFLGMDAVPREVCDGRGAA